MHRRDALRRASAAALLLGLPPRAALAADLPLPDAALFESHPEEYWSRIRKEQFLLPDSRAFLNTGTLGVTPRPVLKAAVDYFTRSADLELNELPRWGGGETFDEYRREMAAFYGCGKDELALTRNTTEGMSTVANGLDLKPGDEVLLTDQEHSGGRNCWLQKQARFGVVVKQAKLPVSARTAEEVAEAVISSIGPRTRVVSFSGITSPTGLLLPVAAICRAARDAARDKGVLSVVDGAHMPGQVPLNLRELGCDFFAGSPHKWLFTPAGCGILYIREEMLDRLWTNTVTYHWDDRSYKAARFQMFGTNNRALLEGHMAALRFVRSIGIDRITARLHQLAKEVRRRAAATPGVEMVTPEDDRLYAGMVSFRAPSLNLKRYEEHCLKRRIWIVPAERIRVSTHIHTRPRDLDLFFETLRESMA